jgi:hypothetical protein
VGSCNSQNKAVYLNKARFQSMNISFPWSIAIFAHNEARNIVACLDSLQKASVLPPVCYVLANACTDATESLVHDYALTYPNVHIVSIVVGDKANAWNVFVHEIAPAGQVAYFFIDGDVRATSGAIDTMASVLDAEPHSNGVSALPMSGRGVQAFQSSMLRDKGVAGNLYGLRGTFLERIRARGIRMPVGTIGEDALVGAMLKWDLRGDIRWDNSRVTIAHDAGFEFDSVSPWMLREWKKYFRRRVRYSIRGYQNKMLGQSIQCSGFDHLPFNITDLYKRYPETFLLKWRGLDTLFDSLAIKVMKKLIS